MELIELIGERSIPSSTQLTSLFFKFKKVKFIFMDEVMELLL